MFKKVSEKRKLNNEKEPKYSENFLKLNPDSR
jgi:hypothetical protein